MNCYEPYEYLLEKRELINKGKYLLQSKCCDLQSCEQFQNDIQTTRHKCNDFFAKYHKDNLDEKGNITSDSLCLDLRKKQEEINNLIKNRFTKTAGKRRSKRKQKNGL